VAERGGVLRVVKDGVVQPEPYLDLRKQVELGGMEQGLLAVAFHPRFLENGRIFVHYSERGSGATIIEEHVATPASADRAAPQGRQVLRVAQPFRNHNGGSILFGPKDGLLYIGLGDGGSGGDPMGHGQDVRSLLGSILRIDVDNAAPYTIPKDNPFVGVPGARPEIWAIGLRNPWRMGFDQATGDLWVGDVGQNQWEEIDRIPAGGLGGANLGWNIQEGTACFQPTTGCRTDGLLQPVVVRKARSPCNSITGGVVYRGSAIPALVGTYLFGDFCHNEVLAVPSAVTLGKEPRDLSSMLQSSTIVPGLASFGEDGSGEVLLVSFRLGRVVRLVPAAPAAR
jgi:glucose/arabinose dehydrogenase